MASNSPNEVNILRVGTGDAGVSGDIIFQTGSNVTITRSGQTFTFSAAGGATWGGITGTLASQTDLQTALNGKANVGSGGVLLQAKHTTGVSQFQVTDTTYMDSSDMLIKITPASTGSKIKITFSCPAVLVASGFLFISLKRNGTEVTGGGSVASAYIAGAPPGGEFDTYGGFVYVDAPASASEVTYTITCKINTNTQYLNSNLQTWTLMAEEYSAIA